MEYNKPCNSNKDCKSNICELIYEDDKPKGRFCIGDDEYANTCHTSKDCDSGICEKIYDDNGRFLVRKCVKAPKVDDDSAFNDMFGKERDNEYGLLSSNTIKLKAKGKGPIAEIIIKLFSIIGNLFNILIFNFDVCNVNRRAAKKKCGNGYKKKLNNYGKCVDRDFPCSPFSERENAGLLYSIWLILWDAIGGRILKHFRYGLVFGGIQKKNYNSCYGKCKKGSRGLDLWFFRTILTFLFPPFGVFMAKGLSGILQVLTCCLLTALFYIPGLIYALIIIQSNNPHKYYKKKNKK